MVRKSSFGNNTDRITSHYGVLKLYSRRKHPRMDLTILFSPVDESVYRDITSPASFFKNISYFGDKMPDYKDAHIALIGVNEERGTHSNQGAAEGADEIRRKLYSLKRGTGPWKIIDLGNLNPGHDLNETYVRISEVCRMLLEKNVLPVI